MNHRQWIGLIPLALIIVAYGWAMVLELIGLVFTVAGDRFARLIDRAGRALAGWVRGGDL